LQSDPRVQGFDPAELVELLALLMAAADPDTPRRDPPDHVARDRHQVPLELVAKLADIVRYFTDRGMSVEQALEWARDMCAEAVHANGEFGSRKRRSIVATFFTVLVWQPPQKDVVAFLDAVQRHAERNLGQATAMRLKKVTATAEALNDGTCRVELELSFDADFDDVAQHDEITGLGVADRLTVWASQAAGLVPAIPTTLSAAFDALLNSGLQDTLREQLKDPATKHRLCDLVRASLAQPPQARAHRGGRGGATDGITAPPPTST